jgi:NAD(P)-dependent dehydrogenase (short-subunit alcohol dehydrogenase family)
MDLGLEGKTVVVTGGSGGIGRGLVLGFAEEGSRVVVATRDAVQGQKVADAAKDLPGEAVVIPTDVTDPASVERLARATEETFGPVDVLVNNAGGVAHPAPFLETPRENWEWEVDLNIWGVVNCTRSFGAGMVERGRGAIVQITSNSALVPEAASHVANYGGTKGYVMSLSKALAYEWGPRGVRINCVAPGWIVPWQEDHVGAGSFWRKYGYELFGTPEAMAKAAAEGQALYNVGNQPIRRIGRPEDVAWIAMFLASERAAHITGQLVSVSGGSFMF